MKNDSEYIEGWAELEKRAGKKFNHKERCTLRECGIIFDKLKGRPPGRHKVVYTYWSLYLRALLKLNGNLIKK